MFFEVFNHIVIFVAIMFQHPYLIVLLLADRKHVLENMFLNILDIVIFGAIMFQQPYLIIVVKAICITIHQNL